MLYRFLCIKENFREVYSYDRICVCISLCERSGILRCHFGSFSSCHFICLVLHFFTLAYVSYLFVTINQIWKLFLPELLCPQMENWQSMLRASYVNLWCDIIPHVTSQMRRHTCNITYVNVLLLPPATHLSTFLSSES